MDKLGHVVVVALGVTVSAASTTAAGPVDVTLGTVVRVQGSTLR